MNTSKQYIGSGKSTKYNGVTVTIRVADAAKFVRQTEDGEFLSFIVSPRKEQVEGKPSHNVFVLVDAAEPAEEVSAAAEPTAEEAPKAKGGRRLKKISKEEAAALRSAQAEA